VSLPDHGGPRGFFGAPMEPGYCVLDGLRTALNFGPLNLEKALTMLEEGSLKN
jgi:triacylglycerol lipase